MSVFSYKEHIEEAPSSPPNEESGSENPSPDDPPEVEDLGEAPVCEECAELGIEDKPATEKKRVNGREKWLCDSCLKAMGFES